MDVLTSDFMAELSGNLQKLHQLGGETGKREKLHQPGGELEFPEIFAYVPWRHHVEIITKCKSVDLSVGRRKSLYRGRQGRLICCFIISACGAMLSWN